MSPAAAPRLHALDNLRALMMWLGIVLHVGVIHLAGPSPLPWRDERRSAAVDVLVAFIHAFRMPVFFILAGYFVALLAQRLGAQGMLRHRLRRLALPFALFWPLLWLVTGGAALLFLHRMARGTWGLDFELVPPGVPRGANTMHLWFLWMLIWFSVATALVLRLRGRLAASLLRQAGAALRALGGRPWGFALLALPLAGIGAFYRGGFLVSSGAFLPPWTEWLHHGLFFVFGLALFQDSAALFAQYQRRWAAWAAAGLLLFLLTGTLAARAAPPFLVAFAYNATAWLWSFAWIGLALRVLSRHRGWLAWLADSTYWVYLVHMPLTVLFGALLFGLPLPVFAKMALNIGATTALCLASYRWWVRDRAIGALLNGRRSVTTPATALPA